MRLHFDLALVQCLLDHSQAATERRPSLEQLYEDRFPRDGKDADLDNLAAGNFPTVEDVDPAKIPPGLWLVGNQGIYLKSNGRPPLLIDPADTRDVTAEAAETNPAVDPGGWWEVKRAAFGDDDSVLFLELPFVEGLIARSRDRRSASTSNPTRSRW